jgi:diguanylate cyclase (GGDEF)-like protein
VRFALVEVDDSGRVTDTNQAFAQWMGSQKAEIVGRPLSDFLVDDLTQSGTTHELLPSYGWLVGGHGEPRPVRVESDVVTGGPRVIALIDGSSQQRFADDLIGRHALVQRTRNRLELVISSSIAFADADSETNLAEILVDTAKRAYAAENAVVFLLDDDLAFHQVAGTNPLSGVEDRDSLAAQGLALRSVVTVSGQEEAVRLSPAVASAFERSGVQAMVVAPIRQGNEPLGVLGIFFHHPRRFDEQASPLAEALSSQAARAVANLRLTAQLLHSATHDLVTGLANRRLLEEHLDNRAGGRGEFVAVIFVDLDGFKQVNDQLGHSMGDLLLGETSRRLQTAVREGDLIARYGGDEFVAVCEVGVEQAGVEIANRIREAIAEPYPLPGGSVSISASVGVAIRAMGRDGDSADYLLRAADQAMYLAKAAGGDRISLDGSAIMGS